MADVKLKAPDGVESIAFGTKVWHAVEGFITAAEEDVKHLLDQAGCTIVKLEEDAERILKRRGRPPKSEAPKTDSGIQ